MDPAPDRALHDVPQQEDSTSNLPEGGKGSGSLYDRGGNDDSDGDSHATMVTQQP